MKKCKFKSGDKIIIKHFDILPDEWTEEQAKYMGKPFIIDHVEIFLGTYEIYIKEIEDWYFLENEVEEFMKFSKLKSVDFKI